jgi:tetratricopeptide (TPR) repeat protein
MKDGRLEEALQDWEKILSSGEPDPYDHVLVGDLLLRLDRKEEARAHYEQAAEAYVKLGLARNAIGVTRKILRLGGDPGSNRLRLIRLYLEEGLGAEAVEEAIVYLESASGPIPPEALELLERVRAEGVWRPEFCLRLAEAYEAAGRKADAADELRALADRLEAQGQGREAASLRERARSLAPESLEGVLVEPGDRTATAPGVPEDPRSAAEEALERGEWERAVAWLEPLLASGPQETWILEKLVAAYLGLGDNAAAAAVLERLAQVLEASGRAEEARERWQELLRLDPRHPEALRRVGTPEAEQETPPAAPAPEAAETQVVVSSKPSAPPPVPEMDMEALIRDLQDAVASQIPDEDPESHYDLALSHYEMGLYAEALEELDRVLSSSHLTPELEIRARELQQRCRQAGGPDHRDQPAA